MSREKRQEDHARYRAAVRDTTRREWESLSGRVTEPLYVPSPDDDKGWERHDDLGYPGEFPYTRGPYPSMYRGKFWTMRQFAGFGSAKDTNERYKYLLEHGQTGLSVAFDMPTLMGYDSDDPLSLGEVGRCGVAISSLEDMEQLFREIPLDKVSTSMTINGPAAIIWAMYIVAAQKQGVERAKLRGTLQNDILKEYIAQKEYLFPPEPSMGLVVDTIEFAAKEMPYWHAVSVSGYHIREAGSTAAQELAFTLADGFAYVEATMERGIPVDDFAPRLSFFFNAHSDFFEEVCKYRAARRIYAKRMRDKYGAKDPASWRLRTHAQTAGCSLTAQQPENNIIRTAVQALAAVLGGTQSLHTNSMDETLALPSAKAAKIALRTQQVLAHETGVADVADPLGGSWFVENLTDQLEEEAEEYFRRIDELGGVVAAIERGFFQQEIGHAAYRFQKSLDDKKYVQVGVNEYVEEEPHRPVEILKITQATEDEQVARVRAVRARRDAAAVEKALARVRQSAKDGENMMPAFIEAVEAYATLGEVVQVVKEVYGEYLEPAVV
jgi:methylmalonyl-CoA mutase N-terminal domain/subunit